jgi:hypothetical protein
MIFDTLAYAQRLKSVGFTEAQAEALAEANREIIAEDMVTRSFLQSELALVRSEIAASANQLRAEMNQLRAELRTEMKELEMRLTVRMGAIGVAVVAALAAIIKL